MVFLDISVLLKYISKQHFTRRTTHTRRIPALVTGLVRLKLKRTKDKSLLSIKLRFKLDSEYTAHLVRVKQLLSMKIELHLA